MSPELIILPALFLAVAYIVHVVGTVLTNRQRVRAAAELQGKLLDRISTVDQLGAFLTTSEGRRFLDGMVEPATGLVSLRIHKAVQGGTVLLCAGVGVFVFVGVVRLPYAPFVNLAFVATLATALGVGLLLSAWASMRLQGLGAVDGAPRPGITPTTGQAS